MIYKIYTLTHPITKEVRYIGYTSTSLKERLRCHLKDVNRNDLKSHKKKWLKSLLREGLIPEINLLNQYETKQEAIFNEIKLIFEYRLMGYNLVNNTDGGEGGSGYKFTEEQRKLISSKLKGRKFKPCSEERKRKISEANKGRKMTEEQRLKMKKPKSESHKINMSLANKGRLIPLEARKNMSEARRKEWAEGKRKAIRKGMKNSESHKEKMRGKNNPFFGKKHSLEVMARIAETKRKNKEIKLLMKIQNES